MTKTIAISLNYDILKYIEERAKVENRTRSGMISAIIYREIEADERLEEVKYGENDYFNV